MRLSVLHSCILLGCSLIILTGAGNARTDRNPGFSRWEGYRTIIEYHNGFLAAGSGGRIDWISSSGKVIRSERFPDEDFNCLLIQDRQVVAAGDHGSILVSSDDGEWQKMESGTGKNIHSLASFNGMILAGADNGLVLCCGKNGTFDSIPLPLKGNIVSLSARPADCYGVTDAGEIIRTRDGMNWDVLDFNQKYSGFYGTCYFRKVLVTENRIAVAGVRDDGLAVLFFSHLGGVWTERSLSYTDNLGKTNYLTNAPNDILYDKLEDEFFLACDEGKLIRLLSCTQCNILIILSGDDLEAITGNGGNLVITGENFFLQTMNFR